MRDELLKMENESNQEYGIRLYSNKIQYGLSNKDCYDIYVANTGDTRAESSVRCEFASILKGYELGFEKAMEGRDTELVRELEDKRLDLEKEKIRFQDQKREYKKYLRQDARFEHIANTIKEEVSKVNKSNPIMYMNTYKNDKAVNQAVIQCGDWHIGAKFNNYFGRYDIGIAKERVNELLDRTIQYCKFHDVRVLHVELLGDNQNGLIHIGSRIESDEDVISQTMTLCEILSNFISELANNIPCVNVYTCMGNHARVSANLSDSMEKENLERIIPWYLETRLKDFDNVEIKDNVIDDGIIMYDVFNTKILAVHGNLDKPTNVVDNMIKMLRMFPDEIHLAHYHHHFEKEEYDIEVSINGTLMGTDTYAKNIRKCGKPMQKLRIYNEDGLLCTYKLKLRS